MCREQDLADKVEEELRRLKLLTKERHESELALKAKQQQLAISFAKAKMEAKERKALAKAKREAKERKAKEREQVAIAKAKREDEERKAKEREQVAIAKATKEKEEREKQVEAQAADKARLELKRSLKSEKSARKEAMKVSMISLYLPCRACFHLPINSNSSLSMYLYEGIEERGS